MEKYKFIDDLTSDVLFEAYGKSLDQSGQEKLIARTLELMEDQQRSNSVETLAQLPQLGLNDLEKKQSFHRVQASDINGCEFLISELDTDHISYIDIGFSISCLPSKYLPGSIFSEVL